MRIAGNRISHIRNFFYSELENLYGREETEALLKTTLHHYLGFSSTDVVTRSEENVNQSDLLKLYNCAKALRKGIPLQYILGVAEFYNLNFKVNPDVLIPRPETEELVDRVIRENAEAAQILDIGTGSGCIPVSIKKNIPSARVYCCDISTKAIGVARENARMNGVNVEFFTADALQPETISKQLAEKMDVIVSNPPYILEDEKSEMAPHVTDHEPHLALFVGGKDPVIFYRRIIDLCRVQLNNRGRLYFELNPLTAETVSEYARGTGMFEKAELLKDMSGATRFMTATKK